MSVVKSEDKDLLQKERKITSEYVMPAVIRREKESISLKNALIWAFLLHPLLIFFILACSFILKILGIDLSLFHKPPVMQKDIEFVLVDKEGTPINKHTKNRADKNSRAGGKHDPKRAVSMPQQSAPKSEAKKPTAPAPAKQEQQKTKPQKQLQQQKSAPAQQQVQQPQPAQSAMPAPKPAVPKPTARPSNTVPKPNPSSGFNIPMPSKTSIPSVQPSTAPVTSSPLTGGSGGSSGGKSSSPAPSFSPSTGKSGNGSGGNGSGAGGGGRFSNGTGNSRGNAGNPGPGNPNGIPGIDAIKEPDFGPYMKELQRRIKMNWDPPKGNESKRVVLLFSIARDGRLLNVKVYKSSGLQIADNAAINAVKLTAPFRPLPPEFKGDKVDIQFTFDYTVFGISGNY